MEITKYVVSQRNDALLVGDYGTYRKQLARRLLTLRRRLGRATPKGRKYTVKVPITAADVSSNPEFIQLLLLTSERAWAHALYMKSMHSADSSARAITRAIKKHLVSRLHKAEAIAAHLVEVLESPGQAQHYPRTVLEARAYYCLIRGALKFESQKWQLCLEAYSEVHLLYTAFANSSGVDYSDAFSELLSSTIDPSIRYAAYQLRLPRTLSIIRLVRQFLPKESPYAQEVLEQDPNVLKEASSATRTGSDGDTNDLPKTISWRKRTVNLEDANIAQALASVSAAEVRLALSMESTTDKEPKERAVAYDAVLLPSQDAVDATKTAIDELTADGVAQGDPRMQALQITKTAVNYALVGWRIGRNRVLCGRGDGAYLEPTVNKKSKRQRKDGSEEAVSEESNGKKLAKLREHVTLYDIILQSIESVKGLPGVAADETLLDQLKSQRSYFATLRCLAIARSHALLGNSKNALALFARAHSLSSSTSFAELPASTSTSKPPNIEVTKSQATSLRELLEGLVTQNQALVEIDNLNAEAAKSETSRAVSAIPLIERLDEYPPNGADLANLVIYPPKLRPIPVKPIFLDVAWNYIDYPGRSRKRQETKAVVGATKEKVEEKKEGRKGWFGFGR